MSGINAIKIYGERNTGTNYVSELLRANFGLRELPGVEALTDKDWARFIRLKKLGFERAVTWAYERTSNRYHARHFNENLGWKHACVPVERVASLAPQGVGLIGLVKNPYAFLTSIYRRPYHHAGKAATLEAFVQEPFTLHARDLLGRARMTLPDVLMLDEPTAGVSPIVMDELFDRIIEVARTGISILMVEQNARQALEIADKGYVLVQGRNAFTDTGKALLADPEVRKSFLGG